MDVLAKLAREQDADIYLHSGVLESPADDRMISLAAKPRRSNAHLFVATYGGLARTAYRMMRGLRHAYKRVTVVVAGPCKSAGTLLVIGADELVMTGAGELGPLDVQVLKDNEFHTRQSGLAPSYAFDALASEAKKTFFGSYVEMKVHGRLTTATAAETAARLTIGLFAPIYAQMDPIRIGEMHMANLVGMRYALELTAHEGNARSNVQQDTITNLIRGYPSHDFVIDRQEAKRLFKNVRHPTDIEKEVLTVLEQVLSSPAQNASTLRLPPREEPDAVPNHQSEADVSDGSHANNATKPRRTRQASRAADRVAEGDDEGSRGPDHGAVPRSRRVRKKSSPESAD